MDPHPYYQARRFNDFPSGSQEISYYEDSLGDSESVGIQLPSRKPEANGNGAVHHHVERHASQPTLGRNSSILGMLAEARRPQVSE